MRKEKRLNMADALPKSYQAMLALEKTLWGPDTVLPSSLKYLVKIRASQINHCAFCIDMHATETVRKGERPQRIYLLSAWQETEIFSPEEKLAIQITEAMTIPGAQGLSDDLYEQGLAQWGIEGMAELLMLVAVINTWNRIAVSTRLGDGIRLQRSVTAAPH
jgi:AhpD family alkylhydroperoxidase